ncbi:MAG: TetR/AcrR family transcriptional regulator [Mycobacteriales bacterium]
MDSRRALLEATKQLVSTQGYQATSPRDVQRACGVGQGSFYHHFGSKADLFASALDELSAEMRAQLDAALDTADDGLGKLSAYLAIRRDALAGCRIGRLALEEVVFQDELRGPVTDYFDHVAERLTHAAKQAGDAGQLPSEIDPAALAALAAATVQGGYVLARATHDPGRLELALSGLQSLLAALATTANPTASKPSRKTRRGEPKS